jgi:endonuclease YncB( thermonuclease family)
MRKIILTLAFALAAHAAGAASSMVAEGPVIIVDGDTLKINGITIRLLDIDTPETYKPNCENELVHGLEAKARLRQLIDSAQEIEYTWNGIDRYGRTLAWVYADGVDVGDKLLDEGLALKYSGGWDAKVDRIHHWCPDARPIKRY